MRRAVGLFALLLCCSKASPIPTGHGGAQATAARGVVTGSGGAAQDAGMDGTGGKPPSDAPMEEWIEQADVGPDCGLPNGGIGPCVDPATDCPPETACWTWVCDFGHCAHVPKGDQ